jgi:hypothetical protein
VRDLEFVLWELPRSVFRQLVHVKLRALQYWTIEDEEGAAAPIAKVERLLAPAALTAVQM